MVVGEVKVKEKGKNKNMVFPDQKLRKGKQHEEKSFILPKCLESFTSCVEDVSELPKYDGIEGRELGTNSALEILRLAHFILRII